MRFFIHIFYVIFLICTSALSLATLPLTAFCDEPVSGPKLLQQAKDTVDSVQSLRYQATYTYADDKALQNIKNLEEVERDSDGRVVWLELDRWWDCRNVYRAKCRELFVRKSQTANYLEYECTWNGEIFRSYAASTREGVSRRHAARKFPMSIIQLMGYGFMGSDDHICSELLRSGNIEEISKSDGSGILEVQATYSPPDGSYDRRISISIDPKYQCFPVKFRVWFDQTETLDTEIVTSRLALIAGVWVPVEGTISQFSIKEHLPDGLTSGEVNAMPKAQADEVAARTKYTAVPFGDIAVIAHGDDLSVNDIQPASFYHIDIPADAHHRDYTVVDNDTNDDKQAIDLPSTTQRWSISNFLFAFLVLNTCLLLARWSWKRFFRSDAASKAVDHS